MIKHSFFPDFYEFISTYINIYIYIYTYIYIYIYIYTYIYIHIQNCVLALPRTQGRVPIDAKSKET